MRCRADTDRCLSGRLVIRGYRRGGPVDRGLIASHRLPRMVTGHGRTYRLPLQRKLLERLRRLGNEKVRVRVTVTVPGSRQESTLLLFLAG